MKIVCLSISLMLIFCGWLGYSYYTFQIKFDEKISWREWKSAENLLGEWEKTNTHWLLNNIPRLKQEAAFQKSWLLAQRGDYEGAIKEFRKAANISSFLKSDALYNATTLSLSNYLAGGGRESLGKLAEDYTKVLQPPNSEDFKTRVNLEIVRILQQEEKARMQPAPGQGEGEKKGGMKKFRPGEKDQQGNSSPEDQKIRY